MRLANNRFEANPNSDRMTSKRKVRCGRQFSRQRFETDLLVQYGALYDSERIDGKYQKNDSRQFHQPGLVKEAGYQRRTAHQHSIQQDTHSQIEPEDGTELFCSSLFLLNECGTESAILYDIGYGAENGKHPYQRIVFDGEYIGYEDTDNKQQNLLAHTVQQVPEQCSYCFLFQ